MEVKQMYRNDLITKRVRNESESVIYATFTFLPALRGLQVDEYNAYSNLDKNVKEMILAPKIAFRSHTTQNTLLKRLKLGSIKESSSLCKDKRCKCCSEMTAA
ncbi:hypothetical protein GJ496_004691 [Pomphorhynchus laevis]|nr:hypothetical protein GJ496_004691 [Pomphorhynchus laevis]